MAWYTDGLCGGVQAGSMGVVRDELAMVEAAVRGDAAALKVLLLNGHAQLCASIGRRIPGDLRGFIDPEDVTQETYTRVFQHIRQFRAIGPDAFSRWTATIALRRLRNLIQWQRAARRGGGRAAGTGAVNTEDSMLSLLDLVTASGPSPSQVVARRDAVDAMQSALAGIPDHYQRAVRLVYIDGRPVAEAAAEMGKTERAVHGLCRRALQLLHERMGSVSQFLSAGE